MSTEEGRWLEGLDERTEQERKAAADQPTATPDAEERERGLRFRIEVACLGYAALTDDDVPEDVLEPDDYRRGARDAAEAIKGELR